MNKINLPNEQKKILTAKLQHYFEQELNQELGEFDAEFLLDFFGEQLGAHFYNQGLRDAQAVLLGKIDDITEAIEEIEHVTDSTY